MGTSRRNLTLLASISEAVSRIEVTPDVLSQREPAGFVGKVLAQSNASLDSRLEAIKHEAAEHFALAKTLERKLKEGGLAVKIDPARIRPSRYANRHPCAFGGLDFMRFVDEIKATGGNREPGIVRPVEGDPDFDYELAAGHRRHRATLMLDLPFFTFVRELSDEDLLVSMVTENKGRKDLSAFERGRHFALLLQDGAFPSLRALASAINEPYTSVQRLLAYGNLDERVIAAFPDPRAIRPHWVSQLISAIGRDRAGMFREIASLRAGGAVPPTEIFQRLSGSTSRHSMVESEQKFLASVRVIHGRPAIVLYKGAPQELVNELKAMIEEYHRSHVQEDVE